MGCQEVCTGSDLLPTPQGLQNGWWQEVDSGRGMCEGGRVPRDLELAVHGLSQLQGDRLASDLNQWCLAGWCRAKTKPICVMSPESSSLGSPAPSLEIIPPCLPGSWFQRANEKLFGKL